MRCSAVVIAALAIACDAGAGKPHKEKDNQSSGVPRDFTVHPALVEIDDDRDVYVVSDVHGGYESLRALLAGNGLIARSNPNPALAEWTGGGATLVIVGDLIDKGAESLEVIDLARNLEARAPAAGGQVITTFGNHEAEFLADPMNRKATSTGLDKTGIDVELSTQRIDPTELAAGNDAAGRGRWLSNLPLGLRIKDWFFAHSGNTQRLSAKDLKTRLEDALTLQGFAATDITGGTSILEAQAWYGDPHGAAAGKPEADALGVHHIVFGHDPGAFGEHGVIRQSTNGILVKIDLAMGLHDGVGGSVAPGALLHIATTNGTIEVLDVNGQRSPVTFVP